MKHLRKFDSVTDMETALASATIDILGLGYDAQGNPVLKTKQGSSPAPDPSIPFYIDVRNTVTLAATSGLQMSTDGKTWTDTAAGDLPTGKTYFRVASDKTAPLQPSWTEKNDSDYDIGGNINSLVKTIFENDTTCYSFFNDTTWEGFFYNKAKLKSAGNLILPATTLAESCYQSMFSGCSSLTAAPELPATTLATSCYNCMFLSCTSLTTAPALPATTLAPDCYNGMFLKCTSLTTAPALPTTTLADSCYQFMLRDCSSLTTAPALPATTLDNDCYYGMFAGCTSLTTAPELPATTLAQNCYQAMFNGCTSLTTAPVLPATTLASGCYEGMFADCTSLNYIKCLATDMWAGGCTDGWVYNVASTGTFVKNPSMTDWATGDNGIPAGWTIKNSSDIELSQSLNVVTIGVTDLDSGTGYYTINGGSHISLSEGTTNIPITQAMNGQTLLVYGEFDGESKQETLTLSWVDYSPAVTITETDNYVTITSATADTIQYRLGSSGEYTTYTSPVYIASDTTIYVIATKTVSGVVYTTNTSQDVTHTAIPPSNLTISCITNTVTISATNAQTIQYRFDSNDSWITYTTPFQISQTVTVYAQATNIDGSITASQECVYISASLPSDMIFHLDAINNNGRTGTWYDEVNDRAVTIDSGCDVSTPGKAVTQSGSMYVNNYNPFGSGYTGDFTISWTGNIVLPTNETNNKRDALSFVGSTRNVSSGDYGTGRWTLALKHGSSDSPQYKFFCNDGTSTTIASTTDATSGQCVVTAIRRSGILYVYRDSTLIFSDTFTKSLGITSGTPILSINGYNALAHGCEPVGWEFYSMFICDRAITSDELAEVVVYQKNRYSIS